MQNFKAVLEEFDETLKQYNKYNYDKLQPPLPNKEIKQLLTSIGIENDDVHALYQWKNGVSDEAGLSMIFSFESTMLSLKNVVNLKDNNNLGFENIDGLVMLFDNAEDCLLFNSNSGEDYGKLHLYSVSFLSIENPYPYFDSLISMFETTIHQYQKGGLIFDTDLNFLKSNTEINIEIYRKFNPLSDFYNSENR